MYRSETVAQRLTLLGDRRCSASDSDITLERVTHALFDIKRLSHRQARASRSSSLRQKPSKVKKHHQKESIRSPHRSVRDDDSTHDEPKLTIAPQDIEQRPRQSSRNTSAVEVQSVVDEDMKDPADVEDSLPALLNPHERPERENDSKGGAEEIVKNEVQDTQKDENKEQHGRPENLSSSGKVADHFEPRPSVSPLRSRAPMNTMQMTQKSMHQRGHQDVGENGPAGHFHHMRMIPPHCAPHYPLFDEFGRPIMPMNPVPFYRRPYHPAHLLWNLPEEQVQSLPEDDLIEPSDSPWMPFYCDPAYFMQRPRAPMWHPSSMPAHNGGPPPQRHHPPATVAGYHASPSMHTHHPSLSLAFSRRHADVDPGHLGGDDEQSSD